MSSLTGSRRRPLRRFRPLGPLALAGSLCVSALCLTCGLDSFIYIEKPVLSDSKDSYFTLAHSSRASSENFQGYEIFYKFYQNEVDAVIDDATFQTDSTNNLTSLYSKMKSSYGYMSFMKNNPSKGDFSDTGVPFIFIPDANKADNLRIVVDFTDRSAGTCKVVRMSDNTIISEFNFNRRKTSANDTDYETFDDISSGDIDLKAGSVSGAISYMQAYAFAVGFDSKTLQIIYSLPTRITTLMQFPLH